MILYTIYDSNIIFGNTGFSEQKTNTNYSEMNVDGIMVQVCQVNNNSGFCVERIISTNPTDYLNPKLQPGAVISI